MTVTQSVHQHAGNTTVASGRTIPLWVRIAAGILLTVGVGYALVSQTVLGTFLASQWSTVKSGYYGHALAWMAAMIPGAIILQHGIYLGGSRRKQFSQALGQIEEPKRKELEELYFGYVPIGLRYAIPAIVVTLACGIMMTALSSPGCYAPWLYAIAAPAPGGVVPQLEAICNAGTILQLPPPWSAQILSGAALGFIGAYVYTLILLADRARQRDVTTGIAIWSAAMPVLGPLMGGVAALLIATGTGSEQGSFTQYAVFFVAGMLPRQFALFVQSGVSKMFQTTQPMRTRTVPLATLRGVGPEVQARLEEEGIFDVSALAYASPHQLMRTTTYSARQIVDWIDEALLLVNLPAHWELAEKLGITGAMDLAWYQTEPGSIKELAAELKMPSTLLENLIARLWQDAQVQDLYKLYWDHTGKPPSVHNRPAGGTGAPGEATAATLVYQFTPAIGLDARQRLLAEVNTMEGVTAQIAENRLIVTTGAANREKVHAQLQAKSELADASQGS